MRAAGMLIAGKSGQAVMLFAAMALTARTLGPADFGALVLVHAGQNIAVPELAGPDPLRRQSAGGAK